ncbi:MAG: hypothetical protein IT361_03030 [Gemmatimonadaceae bacterium]|nr:hypothetical protein [Gemmatimonadaceae bacterium]
MRAAALLRALARRRNDSTPDAVRARLRLLETLARRKLRSARAVAALHDELLFLVAFPHSRTLTTAARRALRGIARRVRDLSRSEARRLQDSGIDGTRSTHAFMHGVARWLVRQRESVVPRWQRDKDAERLDPLIRLSMLPAELDAFDESGLSTRQWVQRASARLAGGVVEWLVGPRPLATDAASRELYENAEVPLVWSLANSRWSTSRNVAPGMGCGTRGPFRRVAGDPAAFISAPLTVVRRVGGSEAQDWVDASLAALAARCREVAAIANANLEEVYIAEFGEGVQLCLMGAGLADRLALEANYGYVMFSNRVPIGYGGVTALANQANTGINIFDAFRGSEAAYVFAQALRAFRGLFGVDRFVVSPYQFGADNDEAIQSGAYWFYDRLGFRRIDARARVLADRERRRLKAPGQRSTPAVLRSLAGGDLVLELTRTSAVAHVEERRLVDLGLRVAASLAHVPAGERIVHVLSQARRQKHRLTGDRTALTPSERRGAVLLGPLLDLIERDASRWSARDRRDLWSVVRAKGILQERTFVRLSRTHERLWQAIGRCR